MYNASVARARYELLAPAGDEECLRAAVANGADAVYFGLEDFNARRRATNFTLDRLPDTLAYLHRHNVKGYVAFNTLVFSDELERAATYIRRVIEAGADALIVQDLGVASLIRRISPTFPIHASTQTTQTHAEGMAVLAESGVSRVILARELSLADITRIAAATDVELEAFVHGALCISYSGQCLASESLWGRSGNRGLCAQACRLPYRLIVDGREQPSAEGDHLLSPHDLATYHRIPELMQAGVTSFKIEGRLKSAEYVACIVRVYRDAIDAAVRGERFVLTRERQEELDQSFSRGFTCGFLDGPRHRELIGARSPKSRGVRIGTVAGRSERGIIVQTAGAAVVKPGDGVVFENVDDAQCEQGGRVYSVATWHGRPGQRHGTLAAGDARGEMLELTFGRGDLDLRSIAKGSRVFKTDDPAVARRIAASYRRDQVARPVPVSARVEAAVGRPLVLTLTDEDGHQVEIRSDEPLAAALRQPLTTAVLHEQLSRLGDTPFQLISLELVGPDGPADTLPVMAPKSVLNAMRRSAVQQLLDIRAAARRHAIVSVDALDTMRAAVAAETRGSESSAGPAKLHVLARTIEQITAVIESAAHNGELGIIYADLTDPREFAKAVGLARQVGMRVGLATPQVIHPGQEHLLDAIARAEPDAVLIRNLTALRYFRDRSPRTEKVGDFSLNVANELTAAVLTAQGLTRLTPGYDLNLTQIARLVARMPGCAFELIVHARVPMFVMAHCPAAAMRSNDADTAAARADRQRALQTSGNSCFDCGRPCIRHRYALRDRNGKDHPLRVDAAGRTTVFNATPQSIVSVWDRVARLPLRHWRVELLDEDSSAARTLIWLYARLARGDQDALTELRQENTRARAGTLEHA